MKLRIITGVSLLYILGGCSTTLPPHKSSDLKAPSMMRGGVPVRHQAEDLRRMSWWKKMHDPVLDRLIQEALANNNQIQAAQANILQAQAQLQAARFAWLPTLGATGGGVVGGGWDSDFTSERPALQNLGLTRTGNIHFKGYYTGFVPKYTLNILQNIEQEKFAKASLEVQKATYQSVKLSVIGQVSGSYFMLLGQKEQLRLQAQLIRDLKKVRQLEGVRFKDGASDNATVLSFDRQIASNEANMPTTENSIAQTENAIQLLLNRNPAPIVTHGDINRLSVRGLIPANVPSAVLKNRPDLMIAQENLKMSEANVGLAYAAFFPTIPITGLLGRSSFELSHLLKLSTALWFVDASASMPLLNGMNYAQIKAAKAGFQAAFYTYLQTLKSVFADVDNSLTNQQKMNKAYEYQLKALQASQNAYRLAVARYKAGAKDYRDVANAQVSVDSAQLTFNLAKMQQLDAIVQVYQALAGGYEVSPSNTL
ncbi:MAG: TolC family protein [Legionellaceae bacterium]|nr:TolC family protein [Legionellaceae bacterium]